MDKRRLYPAIVAVVVVGTLVYFTLRHMDAKPLDDPAAPRGAGPREAVDIYGTSGENKRLTGEEGPGAPMLPPGHPRPPPAGVAQPAPTGAAARDAYASLPVAFERPREWTEQSPTSPVITAQWALAGEGTGPGGMVTISVAGGGVDANVARWETQFGGAKAATSRTTVANMPVTRVDLSGTFSGGMSGGQPGEGWRMLAAIVESPRGMVFVKATGPAAVVTRAQPAFDAFVASFQPR